MKAKISTSILALFSLVLCLVPIPIEASSLSLSPSQGIVGAEITIPSACSYGTGDYHIYWGEADQLIGNGEIDTSCLSLTFTIPESARGDYKVTLKVGDTAFNTDFTVLPSIGLSTEQGTVGSKLTVKGKGFNDNETNIEIIYDGSSVETGIEASSKGSWEKTFKVPASIRGEHIIDAQGTTPADKVSDQTFTVTPKIDISPKSGGVATAINIVGSGFDEGETNVAVTYDGLAVKTGIAADSKGSWQSSFFIPASTRGSHTVDAYGSVTPETDVTEATFAVSPGLKLELVSGHIGDTIHASDSIWVSGFGFEKNEAKIQVTFDGSLVVGGITADARGSWAIQFDVPLNTKGEHVIDAAGDATKAANVAAATLSISPEMEISPTSGAVGDDIVVSGTCFGGREAITISFDGSQIATTSTTDTKGSFTANLVIPRSPSGDHIITVTDSSGAAVSAGFNVESTPPDVSQLMSPEAGSKIGFVGPNIIEFDWSDVNDPSGTYYFLEISGDSNFSSSILRKENLTQSQYTLIDDEALNKGEYYWRVKVVDGAGNEGKWTSGLLFKVDVVEWWHLLVIALAVIGVIAIVWRVVSISRKGGWK